MTRPESGASTAEPVEAALSAGLSDLRIGTSTTQEHLIALRAEVEQARQAHENVNADYQRFQAMADDTSKTPEDHKLAMQLLVSTTDRLAGLEKDLRVARLTLAKYEETLQLTRGVVPTYASLKDLILGLGGKGDKGEPQLNVLEPAPGPLTTSFRGRDNELRLFAEHIDAYEKMASSDRAEHHPYFAATALPGTGKTTFAVEALHHLQQSSFVRVRTRALLCKGASVYLNLNGGDASWVYSGDAGMLISAEARLVARVISIAFLHASYKQVWAAHKSTLLANSVLLTFSALVPLIANALRLMADRKAADKVSVLLIFDEFQHLGNDLREAMVPLLSVMGDTKSPSRCFGTDGILVLPFLTGTSLTGARAVEVMSGHKRIDINLAPLSQADSLVIVRELFNKHGARAENDTEKQAIADLVAHFDAALDPQLTFDALEVRQLCFRVLILDCGGNPAMLVHLTNQLVQCCERGFRMDNEFLDSLFGVFAKGDSLWSQQTQLHRRPIAALPTSLVAIVVASLPINIDQQAVGEDGKELQETWAELFSTCGLTPRLHPSFKDCWMVDIPFVFLNSMLIKATIRLESAVPFPYLHRSGQAFENVVLKIHAARTFHLLGKSALRQQGTLFEQLFPGGFVPDALAQCLVSLPKATRELPLGPQFSTEPAWCFKPHNKDGYVSGDIPVAALSGHVYNTSDVNHHHFEGRCALELQFGNSASSQMKLLLWQTKLSQLTASTTFRLAEIQDWHNKARAMTKVWNVEVVFVLILQRNVTRATTAIGANAAFTKIEEYAKTSGDLVIVIKEHMHEYLAGLAHRLHVPLESTSTATA
eukprot:Unigene11258_Nuclearia_a/m.34394 Unigene11258_Nuclearia_a/g.34394  ORF Unigene11258_Nuclearia_a/g.34394 Unigene11258_Nuclearia_a/m.34394 type:complete len:824 (-) Unigene11258_Nuclearia_a:181-2652(-)